MNGIRRRLTLHFAYQAILLFAFVVAAAAVLLLVLVQMLMNQDLKRSFPIGALEMITVEMYAGRDGVVLSDHWQKQLTKRNYWLQLVDENGAVIYSVNAPADLPNRYDTVELLDIRQAKRYRSYDVLTQLDEMTFQKPVLHLLGYVNEDARELEALFGRYARDGLLPDVSRAAVDAELKRQKQTLQIMDAQGDIVLTAGLAIDGADYKPLDLLLMEESQGRFPTSIAVRSDPHSNHVWILHREKTDEYVNRTFLQDVILYIAVLCGFILLVTVFVSVYHGYRYGRPLLLFMGWFSRLGKGMYEETLSGKERKRLYRKNGKLRRRYRLYKEVIDGFYDMAGKLNASEQERKRLEKTREEWMTGISHDLRTPLSSLQGYGHLLESGNYEWSEEELKAMGRTIREKSGYMLELIEDFSLVFQFKNNAVPLEAETIELDEYVRRIVLKHLNDRTLKDVAFQYEGSDTPLPVQANGKWLTRMLDNLIFNAIKHNPAGTTVTVSARKEQGDAVIAVRDDGVGMDEETLRNLFERYYRGTNTEAGTNGAGLGMSIAQHIARAMGGTIEAWSEPGAGTVVTVRLPLSRGKETDAIPSPPLD